VKKIFENKLRKGMKTIYCKYDKYVDRELIGKKKKGVNEIEIILIEKEKRKNKIDKSTSFRKKNSKYDNNIAQ
jgi:hypothetical protein